MLAAVSWVLLRFGLALEAHASTLITAAALAAFVVAWRYVWREPTVSLRADHDALRVEGPEGTRSIPWPCVEGVSLAAGELSTPSGPVSVGYAQVSVTLGPPVAFSDLSALQPARIRTPDGVATVHDIADPELLVGMVAERVDATALLPDPHGAPSSQPPPSPLRGALVASPSTTARMVTLGLAVHRGVGALGSSGDDAIAGIVGGALALGTCAVVRSIAARSPRTGGGERASPFALAVTIAVVTGLHLSGFVPRATGHWALAVGLCLALPSWPLPGGWIAQRIGRSLTDASEAVRWTALLLLGAVVALLFARGMTLLPMALATGGFEAAEGRSAALRHAVAQRLPRFGRWPPEALAAMRAQLRALRPYEAEAPLHAADLHALRAAGVAPPRSFIPVAVALVAVTIGAIVARSALRGPDGSAFHALRWLLA